MKLREKVELELWRLLQYSPTATPDQVREAAATIVQLQRDGPPIKPVAWRVKDYGDGWTYFRHETSARREAEATGSVMQPLIPLEL